MAENDSLSMSLDDLVRSGTCQAHICSGFQGGGALIPRDLGSTNLLCGSVVQIEKNRTKDSGGGGRGRVRGSARTGRGGSRSTNNNSSSTRAQGLTVSIRNSGVRKGRGTGVRRVSWSSPVCRDHSIRVRRLASDSQE